MALSLFNSTEVSRQPPPPQLDNSTVFDDLLAPNSTSHIGTSLAAAMALTNETTSLLSSSSASSSAALEVILVDTAANETLDLTAYVSALQQTSLTNFTGDSSSFFFLDLGNWTNFNDTNVTLTSLPWWRNWDNIPYERSGYTQLGIVLLGLFITIIMIMIVVGNLLVCIAISTEKSLKTVQNWFIASLAVSDLLLGLVIMPFSLAYELMGYWIFGDIWCEVHHALDVLLCTASINNLCLISLDRYWSVTQAVEYLKKRTPSRAMFMICFVWIFSACVSLPPLIGWKGKDEAGQCSLSDDLGYVLYSGFGSFFIPAVVMVFVYARIFVAARSRARRHVKKKKLLAPSEVTNDPAKDKSTTTTTCTSMSNPSPPELPIPDDEDESTTGTGGKPSSPITPKTPSSPVTPMTPVPRLTFRLPDEEDEPEVGPGSPSRRLSMASPSLSPPPPPPSGLPPPEIVVESSLSIVQIPHCSPSRKTCDKKSESDNKSVSFCTEPIMSSAPRPAKQLPHRLTFGSPGAGDAGGGDGNCGVTRISPILKPNGATNQTTSCAETRFSSVSCDDDSDCVDSPVTKGAGPESRAFLTPNSTSGGRLCRSPQFGSSLSIADYDDSDICDDKDSDGNDPKRRKKGAKVQYQVPAVVPVPRRPTASDAERHKRKIAKQRERRATIILGLIMVSFISAWLPFFLMYLIQGICKECNISPGTFTFAFWLGYCNSAINPIIYTVFNRDFRRAFRKILFR